jgi:hypothetical protein
LTSNESSDPAHAASFADGIASNAPMIEERPIRTSGFLFLLTPDNNEFILYGVRNLGQVPAKGIKHSAEFYVIDQEDNAEQIQFPEDTNTGSLTLFPSEKSLSRRAIGQGLVIRNDPNTKQIKVILKITYHGDNKIDPNTYYYSTTLVFKPAASLEDFNRQGAGNLLIEGSDEGIVDN